MIARNTEAAEPMSIGLVAIPQGKKLLLADNAQLIIDILNVNSGSAYYIASNWSQQIGEFSELLATDNGKLARLFHEKSPAAGNYIIHILAQTANGENLLLKDNADFGVALSRESAFAARTLGKTLAAYSEGRRLLNSEEFLNRFNADSVEYLAEGLHEAIQSNPNDREITNLLSK